MNNKINFILVDDSEVNNYFTEDLIQELEFTNSLRSFLNPNEGLEYILQLGKEKESSLKVLLLDIRMPEMDGFEFLEELGKNLDIHTINLHIIMLTSSRHDKDLDMFKQQSLACEYLNKPLVEVELLEAINQHVRKA